MAESVYIGSVYATFDLKTDGLAKGIGVAQNQFGGLGNTVLGVFGGNLLTSAVQSLGRAVVGFGATAIQAAGDFETGMNFLQAVTSATGAQMDDLSKQAIKLGNDITLPGVSATDAANAMIELGKAGLSVNDILSASKGVLQAAKAGNIDVATSAELVSNALLAFKLSGTEATRVADLFAAAANSSSLEVVDVGMALKQAGAQANALGVPLQDTVTILTELGNAGIKGSDAGTSFKVMLQRLIPQSSEAADVMKQLGIDVFDAQGKFIGVRGAIEQYQKGTANLTQEQRATALQTIFGTDAFRAAQITISEGVAGFDKMSTAVNKAGAAQDLAAARSKGFNGSIEALKNAFETFQLILGTIFLPVLTKVFSFMAKNFEVMIPIVAGLIFGLGAAFVAVVPGIATFGVTLWAALAPILPFIAAGVLLAVGLKQLWERTNILQSIFATLTDVIKSVWNVIQLLISGDFKGGIFGLTEDDPMINALFVLRDILKEVYNFVKAQIMSIFDSLGKIFKQIAEDLKPLIDQFKKLMQNEQVVKMLKILAAVLAGIALAPLIASVAIIIGGLKLLAVVLKFVADHFDGVKKAVGIAIAVAFLPVTLAVAAVIATFKLVRAAIALAIDAFNWVSETGKALATTITNVFTTIRDTIVSVLTAVWNFIQPVLDFIKNLFIIVFGSILLVILTIMGLVKDGIIASWNFIFGVVSAVLGAIWNVISSVWNAIFGVVSAVVGWIGDRIMAAFNFYKDIIVNTFNAVWSFVSTIWNQIYSVITGVVQSIINFFAPAFNWLLQAGKNIINGLISGIRSLGDAVWSAVSFVSAKVGSFFKDSANWLFDVGKNIVQGLINGIKNMVGKVGEAAGNVGDAVKNKLKSVLGIGSPSKVTHKYGIWTGEGLANGVVSVKNMAIGAAADMANGVLEALNVMNPVNGLQVPSFGVAAGSGLASAAANAGGMGGAETNIYGNINISSNDDVPDYLRQLGRDQELAAKGMAT